MNLRAAFMSGLSSTVTAQQIFTDRGDEVAAFSRSVEGPSRTLDEADVSPVVDRAQGRRNVLTLYGVGGIGKTTLSRSVGPGEQIAETVREADPAGLGGLTVLAPRAALATYRAVRDRLRVPRPPSRCSTMAPTGRWSDWSSFARPRVLAEPALQQGHGRTPPASRRVPLGFRRRQLPQRGTHDLTELTSARQMDGGASAWCTVDFRSHSEVGTARLRSSWLTGSSSKESSLVFGIARSTPACSPVGRTR